MLAELDAEVVQPQLAAPRRRDDRVETVLAHDERAARLPGHLVGQHVDIAGALAAVAHDASANEWRQRVSFLRVELDDRNEKLGYRIREAQLRKIPYVLVVGEREAQAGTASLRRRGGEDVGAVPVERIVAELTAEIAARSATLTVGRAG